MYLVFCLVNPGINGTQCDRHSPPDLSKCLDYRIQDEGDEQIPTENPQSLKINVGVKRKGKVSLLRG